VNIPSYVRRDRELRKQVDAASRRVALYLDDGWPEHGDDADFAADVRLLAAEARASFGLAAVRVEERP
jgi:hypothetical protein